MLDPTHDPKVISARIRSKIADLNDELLLAALAEVDVEIAIGTDPETGYTKHLKVWCRQEVGVI